MERPNVFSRLPYAKASSWPLTSSETSPDLKAKQIHCGRTPPPVLASRFSRVLLSWNAVPGFVSVPAYPLTASLGAHETFWLENGRSHMCLTFRDSLTQDELDHIDPQTRRAILHILAAPARSEDASRQSGEGCDDLAGMARSTVTEGVQPAAKRVRRDEFSPVTAEKKPRRLVERDVSAAGLAGQLFACPERASGSK